MIDVAFYLVSESIARRSGAIASKYRTKNNKYILDNKDLARIRLTSEEYVHGLDIEMITLEQAKELIAENRYAMGEAPTSLNQTSEAYNGQVAEEPTSEEPQNAENETQEGSETETEEEQPQEEVQEEALENEEQENPTDETSSEEEVVEEEEAQKTTRKK